MDNIKFLGDICLNDGYVELKEKGLNPFSEVEDYLKDSFVVGNLECFCDGESENYLKKPRLKTNIDTLEYLKNINLSLALLANNHVYDNLSEGFKKTIDFLKQNDIAYIGAGLTKSEAETPHFEIIAGKKICFLNYIHQDTNPNLPEDCDIYLNWYSLHKIKNDISFYKNKSDYIVLNLHWGGRLEGASYPDWSQIEDAKKIINSGADIIVGHHSHTLQPFEIIKDKFVFYSIGNFCFSDFVSDGKIIKKDYKLWDNSMIINLNMDNETIIYDFIKNIDLNISMDDKKGVKYLKRLKTLTFLKKNYLLWLIYYKFIKIVLKLKRKIRNK